MRILLTQLSVAGLIVVLLAGCQTPVPRAEGRPTSSITIRNNCYSLLHDLLSQQQDIGWLGFIKREEADVELLVKRIAANSGAGARLLERFSQEDPSIHLDVPHLPPGEIATRAAIAATMKHELLGQSGDTFELSRLLAETEALGYAWHLAEVASAHETRTAHARALAGIGEDMQHLRQEVFVLLLSKTTAYSTNRTRLQKPVRK